MSTSTQTSLVECMLFCVLTQNFQNSKQFNFKYTENQILFNFFFWPNTFGVRGRIVLVFSRQRCQNPCKSELCEKRALIVKTLNLMQSLIQCESFNLS
jgi:hypothetical protein